MPLSLSSEILLAMKARATLAHNMRDPSRMAGWDTDTDAWLAAIVDSSDDAIVGKTLDTIIRSWNAGAVRLFGYTAEEAIGNSILMLVPPELAYEETEIIDRLTRGQRIEHFQTVRVRKDGTRVEVSISVSPIRDKSGKIIGAAKIARDMTEANRLQRSLASANEQLQIALAKAEQATRNAEEANRAKGEVLAVMSHELRTPLNAIAGYVDLLDMGMRGEINDAQRRDLSRIRHNEETLLRLIEDILSFAKIEAGRVDLSFENVALTPVLERLETFFAPLLYQRGLDYHLTPCESDATAWTDRAKVEQILVNLVTNAIKFTETGSISIQCKREGDTVRLQVKDTGRGIAADMLERIFEPFVQVENVLTRRRGGTGLGLSISRQLARRMHGDLTVESNIGKGAAFTLTLPCHPPASSNNGRRNTPKHTAKTAERGQ